MGEITAISWTDHTFSPFWGCTRVSPACGLPVPGHEDEEHGTCYAETLSNRWGFKIWGQDVGRRTFGEKHWAEPLKWNRAAEKAGKPALVFCGSMCDVMEDRRDLDQERAKLWPLIIRTPWLRWMLTTKRPQNFKRLLPGHWCEFPPDNVWAIVTVETNDYLWRIDYILEIPFAVHAVSCEPLLGEVRLPDAFLARGKRAWVIGGAESGTGARPTNPDWPRSLMAQSVDARVPFHWKQNGEWIEFGQSGLVEFPPKCRTVEVQQTSVPEQCPTITMCRVGKKAAGHLLDGREWLQFPDGYGEKPR